MKWKGVMPAITTCFNSAHRSTTGSWLAHCSGLWTMDARESSRLDHWGKGRRWSLREKIEILSTIREGLKGKSIGGGGNLFADHLGVGEACQGCLQRRVVTG